MPSHGSISLRVLLWISVAAVPAAAGVYIEPYLQDPRGDGMTVLWWTDESQPDSRIEFGRDGLDRSAAASNDYVPSMGKYLHEVRLTGLAPEMAYDYRVSSGPFVSGRYSLRTAVRRASGFRLGVLGDGRTDNAFVIAQHRAVLERAGGQEPDLLFELGDMVTTGDRLDWGDLYRRVVTATDPLDPGSDLGSRVPYHTVVGNHEIYDGTYQGGLDTGMASYRALVSHPPNGSTNPHWRERYYALEYGCATFIVLDTNNTSADAWDNNDLMPDGSTPDWQPGSEQYRWMIDRLRRAAHRSAFTFVLMHPSPYSRGAHGTPNAMTDQQRGHELRVLDEVFRHYGVDAVLSSHDHTVEHCLTGPEGFEAAMDPGDPANLHWLVQGNSGQGARFAVSGWESWMDILGNDAAPFYSTYFYDWAGTAERSFLDIEIAPRGDGQWEAAFRTMQTDGDVYDAFSLFRRDAPPQVTVAGDADVDGDVDLRDFLALRRNFGTTGTTWAMGDFDADGDVDAFDYVALKRHCGLGRGDWSAGEKPVPEPAAGLLLLLGAAAGLRRRRRPRS